jgi:microcystin-dependent protein
VTVNGSQLAPRQQIASVAWANLSEDSSRLGGVGSTGWQRRVVGTCAPGSSVSSVLPDGSVTCEIDDMGLGGETDPRVGTLSSNRVPRWTGPTLADIHDDGSTVGIGAPSSGEKLEVDGRIKDKTGFVIPVGALMPFAGAAAPAGWLLCDGSAVNRTTFADLFNVIGVTYGAGDGSTTFNLPDLRGRAAIGKDNMGGVPVNRVTVGGSGISGTTLGAAGGAEAVYLDVNSLPPHAHPSPPGWTFVIYNGSTGMYSGTAGGSPLHTIGGTGSAGGGAAHQNMPPTIILNYIIKY